MATGAVHRRQADATQKHRVVVLSGLEVEAQEGGQAALWLRVVLNGIWAGRGTPKRAAQGARPPVGAPRRWPAVPRDSPRCRPNTGRRRLP
eukprot:2865270-Pyramimonas_sp.AAC.1